MYSWQNAAYHLACTRVLTSWISICSGFWSAPCPVWENPEPRVSLLRCSQVKGISSLLFFCDLSGEKEHESWKRCLKLGHQAFTSSWMSAELLSWRIKILPKWNENKRGVWTWPKPQRLLKDSSKLAVARKRSWGVVGEVMVWGRGYSDATWGTCICCPGPWFKSCLFCFWSNLPPEHTLGNNTAHSGTWHSQQRAWGVLGSCFVPGLTLVVVGICGVI